MGGRAGNSRRAPFNFLKQYGAEGKEERREEKRREEKRREEKRREEKRREVVKKPLALLSLACNFDRRSLVR